MIQRESFKSIRVFCTFAVLAGALAAGCKPREESPPGNATTSPAAGSKPSAARRSIAPKTGLNVLFVSVDTTRADYLACYGHDKAKTPHIDRLASEGTRFAWCVSSMPLTLGSHSTMLTGSYPYLHGARENGIFKLCEENKTLPEVLHDNGYATSAEVATVILDRKYGLNQGFDHYGDIETPKAEAEAMVFGKVDAKTPPPTTGPNPGANEPTPHVERKAESVSSKVIEALEGYSRSDRPFFIFAHYYDPHWPFSAPEPFSSMFPDNPYLAEIAYFDAHLGKVLEALDRLGLSEKTLVVLTSDHGEGKGQHGEMTHGSFLYDATLHVPLILRCKGLIPAGQVVQAQVRLVDLAETILDLTGLNTARTSQMQGTSLSALLADPKLDLNLVCYSDTLVPKTTYGYSPLRSLRTKDWKYILGPTPELYDLRGDAMELFNQYASQSDRAMDMRQQLWDLIKESPPPPCGRATLQPIDKISLNALRALGYLGSADALDDYTSGNELDNFEPKGENPREHVEEIELMCGGLGSLRIGDFEVAERSLKRLSTLMPDHAVVASALGTALVGLQKYDEAEKVISHSVELTPDDSGEWARLGSVQSILKKYQEAEASLRKALKLDPKNVVALANLGAVLSFRGQNQEAIVLLLEAEKLDPRMAPVQALLGEVYENLRELDKALAAYRLALELDPTSVRAQRGVGSVYKDTGKVDQAIEHLTKAIKVLPKSAILYVQLGQCYAISGKSEEAIKSLHHAIEIDPELSDAYLILGLHLRNLKREPEAVETLQKAVEHGPDMVSAHAQLAAALQKSGRPQESLAAYEKLLAKWPTFGPAVYRSASRVALELHDSAKAIELLTQGTERFKDDLLLANDLAWLLATSSDSRLRNGRRAVAMAERFSTMKEHEDPNFLDTLAAAYAEVGEFEKAVSTIDHAIELAEPKGDKQIIEDLKSHRELYKRGQPYRSQ